jgi:hypothetical protein
MLSAAVLLRQLLRHGCVARSLNMQGQWSALMNNGKLRNDLIEACVLIEFIPVRKMPLQSQHSAMPN